MEHCEPTDLTKALLEHYKVESERLKASFPPETTTNYEQSREKTFLAAEISAAYGSPPAP
jgi:hypothetical protein